MVKDYLRIGITWIIGLSIALLLCVGCTRIVYRDVKIPVPVPCDNEPTDLIALPVSEWAGRHDFNRETPIKEIQSFMDDVTASMIILKTQRSNFKERLDACR